jgi:membrane protease subunit (stomatin/prohibitin family)
MKIEEIRKLLHTQPFRPFLIHVADGGRIPVKHEDFAALAPTGRVMLVYQPDGDYQVVDMMLVTRLQVKTGNGAKKARK